MDLHELLHRQRDQLVAAWLDRVATCDPDPSANLLKGHHDRFRNPIWFAYDLALRVVFDEIVGDMDRPTIASALEPVMHIRAIEALSATDATSFILLLKDVVRDALRQEAGGQTGFETWRAFGSRVDEVSLVAFDLFVACQQKLENIRAKEAAKRAALNGRAAGNAAQPDATAPSRSHA